MNKYLRLRTLKTKDRRTDSKSDKLYRNSKSYKDNFFGYKDLLSNSKQINYTIMRKLRSYSNSIMRYDSPLPSPVLRAFGTSLP
jgi:hypothetical protein